MGMSDSNRVRQLCLNGVETDMASNILPSGKIPPLDNMLTELALIGAGVDEPAIKKKRRRKRKTLSERLNESRELTPKKATRKKATRKKR